MDESLRIIQYLYGEDVDEPVLARRLAEDETLNREYEQLRDTKDALDRRPSQQPDPAVVDEVVDAARAATEVSPPSPDRASDRPAQAPSRTWTRRLQGASATLAVLLLIGLVWWQQQPASVEGTPPPSAAERTAQSGLPPVAAEGQRIEAVSMPEWDDSEKLVRIYRRIEHLQAQSTADAWGSDIQPVSQP